MKCTLPPPLSDVEIIKIVDGEASPGSAAHLEQCAACAERVSHAERLQQRLQFRLRRAACPDVMALVDLVAGLLSDERAASVKSHVTSCPTCTEDLVALRDTAKGMADEWAVQSKAARRTPMGSPATGDVSLAPQRPVALARQVALTVLRGAASGLVPEQSMRGASAKQSFTFDGGQISLQVQPDALHPHLRRLVGKVRTTPAVAPSATRLADSPAPPSNATTRPADSPSPRFDGWVLQLWQGLDLVASTSLEANGAFALGGLQPGRYEPRFLPPAVFALAEVMLLEIEV